MQLLMESWRTYVLLEGVKDDPKQAAQFINALSQEKDEKVVSQWVDRLESDPEVQRVAAQLQQMFSEVGAGETEEIEEGALEDASLYAGSAIINLPSNIDNYLDNTPPGRAIQSAAKPVVALALAYFGFKAVGLGMDPRAGINLGKTAAKVASAGVSGESIAAIASELGQEGVESMLGVSV